MTPKSLLRNKMAVSHKNDFLTGSSFHRVLWDDAELGNTEAKLVDDKDIKKVVLCSGKVYYDLLKEREERKIRNIYLLRLEQFYPFPAMSLTKELNRFKSAKISGKT